MQIIGLISDTHGLLRQEAIDLLNGSDQILHAGDIGSPGILERLQEIAPVTAVRGNNDREKWAQAIPETQEIQIAGHRIFLIHNVKEMKLDPVTQLFNVVVFGHSHRSLIEHRNGVLFVNPGSAGPRRFGLPVTIGKLHLKSRSIEAEILYLP